MNFIRITNFAMSQFMRHFTLVFSGNIFAAGLGFLTVLIISRKLTVSDFGLFNVAISIIPITFYLSCLGMNTAMVTIASSYLCENKKAEAFHVLKASFFVITVLGSFFAGIIFLTADFLSEKVFQIPSLTPLLKLAAFGGLSVSLLNYLKSTLHVFQMFRWSVAVQLFVDGAKLFAVIGSIFFLQVNVLVAVAIFTFVPFLSLMFGFKWFSVILRCEKRVMKGIIGRFLSYSKWIFVGGTCRLLLPYVGLFMITKIIDSKAAGFYGLALNLSYIFPIMISSLQSVLLPKVSKFRKGTQYENYIKNALRISTLLALIFIPFIFFSRNIIVFCFGLKYTDCVSIFNVLVISYLMFTISSAIHVALYSLNKPHVVAFVDAVKLATMVIGCYFLIPLFGVIAPAFMLLVINAVDLGFYILYVFRYMRNGLLTLQTGEIIKPQQGE